ncbi:hypothetical protein KC326_g127 [Hortaea werneckii]|nr:hypothetical protein KC326_g127 [Hortaea werneckii]
MSISSCVTSSTALCSRYFGLLLRTRLSPCSDHSGRQFIFHQLNNGSIQRVEVIANSANGFKTYKVVQDGAHRTSLAAIDAKDGAIVFFRDPTDPLSITGKDMTNALCTICLSVPTYVTQLAGKHKLSTAVARKPAEASR